jgi:hypothetical protein
LTDIGPPTALIMQRIADTDEPPEAQRYEALAAVDRVSSRPRSSA